jgi:hypothetical protein
MTPALVVCADWSASTRRRAVWAADVLEAAVFPLSRRAWTLADVLAEADDLRGHESAIVAFDAPLGLPRTYLAATGGGTFVDWLCRDAVSFDPVQRADEWSVERPFVRPLPGEWRKTVARARRAGVELRREIDVAARAESVFKCIGAKQVAGAARSLWRELRDVRARAGVTFRLWPFETGLDAAGIVVAEIYPALAYAEVIPVRPRSKADAGERRVAIEGLAAQSWLRLQEADVAARTEDDFDACVAAAALLARIRAGRPLTGAAVDPVAEGGILLAS